MTAQAPVLREHGNSYNIFILVLTMFSLAIMVLLFLPIDPGHATCYAVRQRGVRRLPDRLRLQHHGREAEAGLLHRPARLAGPARIDPVLRGLPARRAAAAGAPQPARADRQACCAARTGKALVADVLENRGQYATFITLLAASSCSAWRASSILQVESRSPDANITDRRRRPLVGPGDDHDGWLRRLLPGDAAGRIVGHLRHVRRRRDHRRPRQHPRQHAGPAAEGPGAGAGRSRPRTGQLPRRRWPRTRSSKSWPCSGRRSPSYGSRSPPGRA